MLHIFVHQLSAAKAQTASGIGGGAPIQLNLQDPNSNKSGGGSSSSSKPPFATVVFGSLSFFR